jgi:predicted RNA methylase
MNATGAESDRIYARFPAGFGPVVGRCLDRASIERSRLMDEACVFTFAGPLPPRIAGIFSAVYRLVDRLDPRETDMLCPSDITDGFARRLPSLAFGRKRPSGASAGQSFRARVLVKNEPVAVRDDAITRLEAAFSLKTGMKTNRRGGGGELCVLIREDGEAFLLYRGPDRGINADRIIDPGPGELPARTARLLCECSSPRDEDLFLDPFAGGGSIPFQRALMAPFRLIFAQDIDPDRYALMRSRLSSKALAPYKKRIFPKSRDARDLSSFKDGSVTAIVTDPPWGSWEGGISADEASGILPSFLSAARRVLAPGGRAVILLSRAMAVGIRDSGRIGALGFREAERLDVLISGRKASVLILG